MAAAPAITTAIVAAKIHAPPVICRFPFIRPPVAAPSCQGGTAGALDCAWSADGPGTTGGIMVSVVRDPHEVLGINPGASPDEVRAAWRLACRRTHPDLGGRAEAFREARSAYQAILDGEYAEFFAEQDAHWSVEPDPLFAWPVGLSEVTADRWGWIPRRSALASVAMLLCLVMMVVMLFAPAILAGPGN